MNLHLTEQQQIYLKSKGFKLDSNKNSGFYFIEDSDKTTILIAYEDDIQDGIL